MKRIALILTLFSFMAFNYESKAQGTASLRTTLTGTKTTDTLSTATDTVYFYMNGKDLKNGSIQVIGYAIGSAPVATGLLQVSNDGVRFFTRQAAEQINGDTINLKPVANGVKNATLCIKYNNYAFYRVLLLSHHADDVRFTATGLLRRD